MVHLVLVLLMVVVHWCKLHPSSSRYLSIPLRSGIYTVSVLNGKDRVNVSVQFHARDCS